MTDKQKIINEIIQIPIKYHDPGGKSPITLLRETGYYECHRHINKKLILQELMKQPETIQHWIQWCEDKRTDKAWIFKQSEEDDDKYIVGLYNFTLFLFSDRLWWKYSPTVQGLRCLY